MIGSAYFGSLVEQVNRLDLAFTLLIVSECKRFNALAPHFHSCLSLALKGRYQPLRFQVSSFSIKPRILLRSMYRSVTLRSSRAIIPSVETTVM